MSWTAKGKKLVREGVVSVVTIEYTNGVETEVITERFSNLTRMQDTIQNQLNGYNNRDAIEALFVNGAEPDFTPVVPIVLVESDEVKHERELNVAKQQLVKIQELALTAKLPDDDVLLVNAKLAVEQAASIVVSDNKKK